MGIKNLNSLFANSTDYSQSNLKFNTIIIDGSNLVITYLCSVIIGIIRNGTQDCIVNRALQTIREASAAIIHSIRATRRRFSTKDGRIIVMFDSSSNPDYRIRINGDYKIVKAKEQESLNRAKNRNDSDKTNREIEIMQLNGASEEEIINHLQKIYLNSPKNHFKLTKYVTDLVVSELSKEKNIKFFRAISETDFVIRNLALVHTLGENDSVADAASGRGPNVLIMSADTDYLVLTSDIENVYVRKTQQHETKIIYPYEAWREILNRDLTYEEVCMLGIIFGCDYNNHSGYILINGNKIEQTIENISALFKTPSEAISYFNKTRMRSIKAAIKEFNQDDLDSATRGADNQVVSPFLTKLVKVNHKHLLEIYQNWEWNADFIPYECDCQDLRSSVLLYLSKHAFEMPGYIFKEGDELKYGEESKEDGPKKYNAKLENITYLYDNENKLIDNVETYLDELLKEDDDYVDEVEEEIYL